MRKFIRLAFFFLFFPVFSLLAQETVSLDEALNNANSDEEKLTIYIDHISELVFLDINNAIELANKAYDIALELSDTVKIGELHNLVGTGYYLKGNNLVALDYFLKALDWFEMIDEKEKIARIYNNLGITYDQIHNHQKALEYHFKSISINERTENKEDQTASFNNIGNVYESLMRLDSAEFYYRQTLDMAIQFQLRDLEATAYLNIGNVYNKRKDYKTALGFLRQALILDEKANNYMGIVETYGSLGEAYTGLGNYEIAYRYLIKALENSQIYDLNIDESRVYKLISNYYEKKGEYFTALEYFKKHTNLKDSIYSLDATKQIEDLQISYEKRKQDQEITLLQERNNLKDTQLALQKSKTRLLLVFIILFIFILGLLGINVRIKGRANKLLKSQNEKIQQQNIELEQHSRKLEEFSEEKDNFINVVAHDLKSPLNNIVGLSNLIKINGKLSEEQLQYLNLLEQVSGEAKNLITNLLDINKLESGLMEQEFIEFNVQQLIDKVIHNFDKSAAEKHISIKKTCVNKIIINSNKEFIERILDNLISNAIKFSPEKKSIDIACDYNYKFLVLSVKDNGPGFTEKDMKDMYKKFQKLSARPTGGESSTGLGLAIVKLLVEKLDGNIEVISKLKKGTEFRVKIPTT